MNSIRKPYIFHPNPSKNHKSTRDDALVKRVKFIMDYLGLFTKEQDLVVPGAEYIIQWHRDFWLRISWFIIFLTSFTICGYQIVNRIMYYYEYPTTVSVTFQDNDTMYLPSVTLCAQVTEESQKLINKYQEEMDLQSDFPEINFIRNFLKIFIESGSDGLEPSQLWVIANFTTALIDKGVYLRNKKIGIPIVNTAMTAYSSCPTFHIVKPIKFERSWSRLAVQFKVPEKANTQAPIFMNLHSPLEPPGMKAIMILKMNATLGITYGLIQYNFVNSPINPCVSDEEFRLCQKKCLQAQYKKSKLKCRLPFVPEVFKTPNCTVSSSLLDSFAEMSKIELRTDAVSDCKCTRRCTQPYLDYNFEDISQGQDKTTLNFYYSQRIISYYDESYAYTIIGLFCDIGGNLGLYSGLSVLSMFQIVHNIGFLFIKKKQAVKMKKNPMYQLIQKVIREEIKKKEFGEQYVKLPGMESIMKNDSPKYSKIMWVILLILATLGIMYLLYNRFMYFFTYPISVTITVLENTTISFPDFLFCAEPKALLREKKFYVKKRNRNNWCEVDMLDLLEDFDMHKIWKKSDIAKDSVASLDTGLEAWGFPLLDNYTESSVISPYGICALFSIPPQAYSGTSTALTLAYKIYDDCGNNTIKFMILSPQDKEVEYITQTELAPSTTSFGIFRQTNVHFYSRPGNPCMQTDEFTKCKTECLEKKLLKKIHCRLPFLHFEFLPDCETPSEAKVVRNEYLKIYTETDVTKDCGCHKQCFQNIYGINVYTELQEVTNRFSFIIICFHTNFVRVLREVENYSIIKLLCDTGGILGLAMGMSVLSICDLLQTIWINYNNRGKK